MKIVLLHPALANARSHDLDLPLAINGDVRHREEYGKEVTAANIKSFATWFNTWKQRWSVLQRERKTEQENGGTQPLLEDWNDERFQLYIIGFQPPVQFYRFDDQAVIGFFLHVNESRQGPQIRAPLYRREGIGYNTKTIFGRAFIDEFDLILKLAKRYDFTKDLSQLRSLFPDIPWNQPE